MHCSNVWRKKASTSTRSARTKATAASPGYTIPTATKSNCGSLSSQANRLLEERLLALVYRRSAFPARPCILAGESPAPRGTPEDGLAATILYDSLLQLANVAAERLVEVDSGADQGQ